jgi:hypothetical protein
MTLTLGVPHESREALGCHSEVFGDGVANPLALLDLAGIGWGNAAQHQWRELVDESGQIARDDARETPLVGDLASGRSRELEEPSIGARLEDGDAMPFGGVRPELARARSKVDQPMALLAVSDERIARPSRERAGAYGTTASSDPIWPASQRRPRPSTTCTVWRSSGSESWRAVTTSVSPLTLQRETASFAELR